MVCDGGKKSDDRVTKESVFPTNKDDSKQDIPLLGPVQTLSTFHSTKIDFVVD